MRKQLLTSAILGLTLPFTAQAAPKVAVDIAPLHSLVSQVMEGVDEPKLLIPAEATPHHYTLKPSQARALANADLVFWMGEDFTPWLEKSIANVASSATSIEALHIKGTTTYAFREGATFEAHEHHDEHEEKGHDEHEHHDDHKEKGHDEHEHHDDHKQKGHDEHEHHDDHKEKGHDEHEHHDDHKERGHDEHEHHDDHHGHDHEGEDPHAWLDPENAKVWVKYIAQVLAQKDPENAKLYQANATKTVKQLDALIHSTEHELESLHGLKFIVFHDAYQYFERRFNMIASGSISINDAQTPSPARIQEVKDTVNKLGVTCIFTEPQFNARMVENVFTDGKVTIAVMDPLGASIPEGKGHYSALIKQMANSLKQCK